MGKKKKIIAAVLPQATPSNASIPLPEQEFISIILNSRRFSELAPVLGKINLDKIACNETKTKIYKKIHELFQAAFNSEFIRTGRVVRCYANFPYHRLMLQTCRLLILSDSPTVSSQLKKYYEQYRILFDLVFQGIDHEGIQLETKISLISSIYSEFVNLNKTILMRIAADWNSSLQFYKTEIDSQQIISELSDAKKEYLANLSVHLDNELKPAYTLLGNFADSYKNYFNNLVACYIRFMPEDLFAGPNALSCPPTDIQTPVIFTHDLTLIKIEGAHEESFLSAQKTYSDYMNRISKHFMDWKMMQLVEEVNQKSIQSSEMNIIKSYCGCMAENNTAPQSLDLSPFTNSISDKAAIDGFAISSSIIGIAQNYLTQLKEELTIEKHLVSLSNKINLLLLTIPIELKRKSHLQAFYFILEVIRFIVNIYEFWLNNHYAFNKKLGRVSLAFYDKTLHGFIKELHQYSQKLIEKLSFDFSAMSPSIMSLLHAELDKLICSPEALSLATESKLYILHWLEQFTPPLCKLSSDYKLTQKFVLASTMLSKNIQALTPVMDTSSSEPLPNRENLLIENRKLSATEEIKQVAGLYIYNLTLTDLSRFAEFHPFIKRFVDVHANNMHCFKILFDQPAISVDPSREKAIHTLKKNMISYIKNAVSSSPTSQSSLLSIQHIIKCIDLFSLTWELNSLKKLIQIVLLMQEENFSKAEIKLKVLYPQLLLEKNKELLGLYRTLCEKLASQDSTYSGLLKRFVELPQKVKPKAKPQTIPPKKEKETTSAYFEKLLKQFGNSDYSWKNLITSKIVLSADLNKYDDEDIQNKIKILLLIIELKLARATKEISQFKQSIQYLESAWRYYAGLKPCKFEEPWNAAFQNQAQLLKNHVTLLKNECEPVKRSTRKHTNKFEQFTQHLDRLADNLGLPKKLKAPKDTSVQIAMAMQFQLFDAGICLYKNRINQLSEITTQDQLIDLLRLSNSVCELFLQKASQRSSRVHYAKRTYQEIIDISSSRILQTFKFFNVTNLYELQNNAPKEIYDVIISLTIALEDSQTKIIKYLTEQFAFGMTPRQTKSSPIASTSSLSTESSTVTDNQAFVFQPVFLTIPPRPASLSDFSSILESLKKCSFPGTPENVFEQLNQCMADINQTIEALMDPMSSLCLPDFQTARKNINAIKDELCQKLADRYHLAFIPFLLNYEGLICHRMASLQLSDKEASVKAYQEAYQLGREGCLAAEKLFMSLGEFQEVRLHFAGMLIEKSVKLLDSLAQEVNQHFHLSDSIQETGQFLLNGSIVVQ